LNGCSVIQLTESANADLLSGYWFYEAQQVGLGALFLNQISSDIDALLITAGVHTRLEDSHVFRSLAHKFPFAIYYLLENETATVVAVLDARRSPIWTQNRLSAGH
jgi:plasmid stabilization system protein ParE